ncbi:MAG: hypothetical protein M1822_002463 [Bathelium mastoideum]|nr:MAG: hypothetical protein M1822_002463 [Bathelium mastoideum]
MTFHRFSILLSALAAFTAATPRPQGVPISPGNSPSSYNSTGPGNSTSNATYLQLPAVVSGPNGNTQFQCWQLNNLFVATSPGGNQVPEQLNFGDVTGAGYTVQPPDSDGGVHTTPVPVLLHVLSGLVRIDLPNNSSSTAWLLGGVSGALVLADSSGTGYHMTYPSDESTVSITLPFAGGKIPPYTVVGLDVCTTNLGALGQAT